MNNRYSKGSLLFAVLYCLVHVWSAQAQVPPVKQVDRATEARTVLDQIELALTNIGADCGASVIKSGRADVFCKKYGQTTIGEAWNSHLVAVGFPNSYEQREELAKRLGLDPSLSLVLMGSADHEKIGYLVVALRTISSGR